MLTKVKYVKDTLKAIGVIVLLVIAYILFAYAERYREMTRSHLAIDQQLISILQNQQKGQEK